MQWETSDHQDWRAIDHTRWLNIGNYQNLKARAGVYVFADVNHQVKYIGKAGAGRIVDETYNAIYRDKNRGATQVKVLYTNSDSNATSLEAKLIDKYNPPNNLT